MSTETQTKMLYEMICSVENAEAGSLSLIDGYECENCLNRGYNTVISAETGMPVRRYCQCLEIRRKIRKASNSGLGQILTQHKFSNFVTSEPWQMQLKSTAVDFCRDDQARWFFVGGQSGSGKTHICTAICSQYLKRDNDLIYMSWTEASKKLKAIANEMYFGQQIDVYKRVDVLYIDDFLKSYDNEPPTRADILLAFEIINARLYDPKKITIISSEITLDELIDLDEATMSRIFQMCGKYKITIIKDRSRNYRLKSKNGL